MIYNLIIRAVELAKKDGGKFIAYQSIEKTGKIARIKFTKDCEPPRKVDTYKLTTDSITRDKTNIYSVYWVRNIISCEPYQPQDTSCDDDLPFPCEPCKNDLKDYYQGE